MDFYKLELKKKELITYESKKIILKFEKKNGKSKFIEKYKFRSFLKEYEVNQMKHLNFNHRSLVIKKFYKYFKIPFFDADFTNLESNTQLILKKTFPLILNEDEIPKSEITKTISEKLDLTINEHFSFKNKEEKVLIKQVAFRTIFENFLPELKGSPNNAIFIK